MKIKRIIPMPGKNVEPVRCMHGYQRFLKSKQSNGMIEVFLSGKNSLWEKGIVRMFHKSEYTGCYPDGRRRKVTWHADRIERITSYGSSQRGVWPLNKLGSFHAMYTVYHFQTMRLILKKWKTVRVWQSRWYWSHHYNLCLNMWDQVTHTF